MTTADKWIAFLTGALVFATLIYAYLTFRMMRSQKKIQLFNSRPVIGIEVPELGAFEDTPLKDAPLWLEVRLVNLMTAPALRIKTGLSIELLGSTYQLLFPVPDVPFLIGGDHKDLDCIVCIAHESVFNQAKKFYADMELLQAQTDGPVIRYKQDAAYPECQIDVEFENHLGDRGKCSSRLKIAAIKKVDDDEYKLRAVPLSPEESLICSWEETGRTRISDVFRTLYGSIKKSERRGR